MKLTPEQERSLNIISRSLYTVPREMLEAQFMEMVRSNMELTNALNEENESQHQLLQLLIDELINEGIS
jgi:hypothetical protein